jgi:hypothetical protein
VTAADKAAARAAAELGEHLGPFRGAEELLRRPHPGGVPDGILADTVEARTARVLQTAHGMVGRLRWSQSEVSPSQGWSLSRKTSTGFRNDFAGWIRGGPEPGLGGAMSCSEATMYIAHEARAVDLATLQGVFGEASRAARSAVRLYRRQEAGYAAWDKSISDYLGPGRRTRVRLSRRGVVTADIPAGHLVFMDDLDHVALSRGTRDAQGRHEIFSHWTVPHQQATPYGALQLTTLEEVVAEGWTWVPKIESAAPTWLIPGRWGTVAP